MTPTASLTLTPLQATIEAPIGTPLHSLLYTHGVEFPCGGKGVCRGCRVKVLDGHLAVTVPQGRKLSPAELADGWRLACQCTLESDLHLEVAQWDAPFLTDETAFDFVPREGIGVAVDVGTTTIVSQMLDLRTGTILAVETALNQQAVHGADVMSRVDAAVTRRLGHELTAVVRRQVASMMRSMIRSARVPATRITDVVLVGNAVMHHLFGGLDCAPLAQYPFVPTTVSGLGFSSRELEWELPPFVRIRFLPLLGGFVGSDILAGILATDMHRHARPACLIDLGTNGEVVIGSNKGLVCSSTAAGPAFEGARISMGMRAATGAIAGVSLNATGLHCEVIGDVPPRGICGSGLVDAAAAFLDAGTLEPSGLLTGKSPSVTLAGKVRLSQTDIRELQLAKGAIAAGVKILCEESGTPPGLIDTVYLAGAFGNYVNRASAQRIGLIDFPPDRVRPSGNTALHGAKRALYTSDADLTSITNLVRHVSLHAHPRFQDFYVEAMTFPDRTAGTSVPSDTRDLTT
jgi:uncharacterized 2Fe-2S/4Fe-4S cluster protein (DUF4445 family)